MNVICADGTRLQCATFEATDSGVLLFDEEPSDEEDERAERQPIGFVPITELRYVLPEGVTPGPRPGQQAGTSEQRGPPIQSAGGAGPQRSQSQSSPGPRRRGPRGPPGSGRQQQ